jgi:hypothetical protein
MISITPFSLKTQEDLDNLKSNFCALAERGYTVFCNIDPEFASDDALWDAFASDKNPFQINDGFTRKNTTIPVSTRPQKSEDAETPKRRRA